MSESNREQGTEDSIIYDIRVYPDKQSGRCDNCGTAHFNSSVSNGKFIRECSNCGMKKSI